MACRSQRHPAADAGTPVSALLWGRQTATNPSRMFRETQGGADDSQGGVPQRLNK